MHDAPRLILITASWWSSEDKVSEKVFLCFRSFYGNVFMILIFFITYSSEMFQYYSSDDTESGLHLTKRVIGGWSCSDWTNTQNWTNSIHQWRRAIWLKAQESRTLSGFSVWTKHFQSHDQNWLNVSWTFPELFLVVMSNYFMTSTKWVSTGRLNCFFMITDWLFSYHEKINHEQNQITILWFSHHHMICNHYDLNKHNRLLVIQRERIRWLMMILL